MQRFLQFSHGLPTATGRLAGAGHVDMANRVCLACNSGAIGDEMHMVFEWTALAQQHANLSTPHTNTMRSAGPSGGLELRYRLSEYDIIAMIGTSDQSCRLFKILLLVLRLLLGPRCKFQSGTTVAGL